MTVLQTRRLLLRELDDGDAEFVAALLNDPDWLRYIGDRGVRTPDDARRYLAAGPVAMYARHGFGLYATVLRSTGEPIGICGLIRREGLDDVDLGFAFLPQHRGRGYAEESAAAVVSYARDVVGLARIVAIASAGNLPSTRLLTRLGFSDEGEVRLPGDSEPLRLFARPLR